MATGLISANLHNSVAIIWSAAALTLRSGLAHARTIAAFRWDSWQMRSHGLGGFHSETLPKKRMSGAFRELKTAGSLGTRARSSSIEQRP